MRGAFSTGTSSQWQAQFRSAPHRSRALRPQLRQRPSLRRLSSFQVQSQRTELVDHSQQELRDVEPAQLLLQLLRCCSALRKQPASSRLERRMTTPSNLLQGPSRKQPFACCSAASTARTCPAVRAALQGGRVTGTRLGERQPEI